MSVIFNVLHRGKWKNLTNPITTKSYTNTGKTPTDDSPKPLQSYRRPSSESSDKYYEYNRAILHSGKIAFGFDNTPMLDLYNLAYMPFSEPNSVSYHLRKGSSINLAFSKRSTKNLPFSDYASKFSKNYGIFYGYRTAGGNIRNITWNGVSLAEKDSLPTIKRFSTGTSGIAQAGKIFTKNFSFQSATGGRHIYIYPNRVVDGSTIRYFDDGDINCKVKYIYIQSQSTGGNGGRSHSWGVLFSEHHVSGAGGGAGGYSVDLVKIPENGYIKIYVPETPVVSTSQTSQIRNNSVNVYVYDPDYQANEITCYIIRGGQWGSWGADTGTMPGGAGGYRDSYDDKYMTNVINVTGPKGANSNKNYSGSVEAKTFAGLLEQEENKTITLPAINKYGPYSGSSWWDSFDDAYVPGRGAASYFGTSGNYAPLSRGGNGGIGAGGGGGAKEFWGYYAGGAGGGAYVTIGF